MEFKKILLFKKTTPKYITNAGKVVLNIIFKISINENFKTLPSNIITGKKLRIFAKK